MLKSIIWPWPNTNGINKENLINLANNALSNKFILPVVGPIDMGLKINWNIEFKEANNTKLLWMHSLPYVQYLIEAFFLTRDKKYFNYAEELIESYFSWTKENKNNRNRAWQDEHSVANRCCVIGAAIYAYQRNNSNIINNDKLLLLLKEHAFYLSDCKNYVRNNHGVMMDQMLLQSALIMLKHEPSLAEAWIQVATKRLSEMIDTTFDKDGCCTENSSIYHMINLNLFKEIINFAEINKLELLIKKIKPRLIKAEKVAPLFLRDDKSLPMIGDTVGGPSNLLPEKSYSERLGRGFFPEAGIILINEKNISISIKCGGSTYNHRHVDDTSITVRYAGTDIFVDAGLYNYQSHDPIRQWITSYLAHSGFFIKKYKDVEFPYKDRSKLNLPPANEISGISNYLSDENYIFTELESKLIPGADLKREIQIILPNIIIIRDVLSSIKKQQWRQQFILHPNCDVVANKSNYVLIKNKNTFCKITQHKSFPIFCIEDAWYSEKFMKAEKTKSIVFSGESSSVELLTTIVLSANEKNEYSDEDFINENINLKSLINPKKNIQQKILINQWISDNKKFILTEKNISYVI